jgi:hypothetical protein
MSVKKREITDGVRKALAAQRLESLSLVIAGSFTAAGLGMILFAVFTREDGMPHLRRGYLDGSVFWRYLPLHLTNPMLYVGLIVLALGLLAYRTTVAFQVAKKGPRIPHRIRLPFDSTVEIGVTVNQVQGRTDVLVGDRRLPEPKKETETSE